MILACLSVMLMSGSVLEFWISRQEITGLKCVGVDVLFVLSFILVRILQLFDCFIYYFMIF